MSTSGARATASPLLLGAQDQEGLGEAREHEDPAQAHHRPVGERQTAELLAPHGVDRSGGPGSRRLIDPEEEKRYREGPRDDRHQEDRTEVVGPQQHQPHREQRPEEGPDGVERLAQPDGRTAHMRWADVGDQGVPRSPADALADPIRETGDQHPSHRRRERNQRLRPRT